MKIFLVVAASATLVTPSLAQQSDRSIATGIDFELEASLVPVIEKYSACVNAHRPMVINGSPTVTESTETAIAACKAERAAAMREADAVLAKQPGWENKSKRDAEIISDFDNTDASARKIARETDAYFHRVNG